MTDFLLLAFFWFLDVCGADCGAIGVGLGLGYLIAGILISPVLAVLRVDIVSIQHFAEFGVVMMLFLVGLSWSRKACGTCGTVAGLAEGGALTSLR